MKKILLALAIASASLVTLNSCTKEYITNNQEGVSYVYNLKSNNWSRIGNSRTYEAVININDLDGRYFEDGHVSVAVSLPTASGQEATYEIIPATVLDFRYSANYSIGKVRIFADYLTDQPLNPGDMSVKVVLTDARVGN